MGGATSVRGTRRLLALKEQQITETLETTEHGDLNGGRPKNQVTFGAIGYFRN